MVTPVGVVGRQPGRAEDKIASARAIGSRKSAFT
jgi:hypothetical protein